MISVIITTHNRLDDLKKAVESVKQQTYKDIEIIVVDDNSDDGTKDYFESDPSIIYRFISSKEHKNGNYARNQGIKLAKGNYIAFLDDDDVWFPTKLEKQLHIIKSRDCGMVYVARKFLVNEKYTFDEKIDPRMVGDLKQEIFCNIISTTSCIMVKREVLNKVGAFDEELNYWQEYDLLTRICMAYKAECVNEPLTLYRMNFSDKKRLSNKVEGFKEAVKRINSKYAADIKRLPEEIKHKREAMIYAEIANRYDLCGKRSMARRYMWKSFCSLKNTKTFLKWVLCYTTRRKMMVKIALNKIKS